MASKKPPRKKPSRVAAPVRDIDSDLAELSISPRQSGNASEPSLHAQQDQTPMDLDIAPDSYMPATPDVITDAAQSPKSARVSVDLSSVFREQVKKAASLGQLKSDKLGAMKFNVATLCSGTDAPILACEAFQEACRVLELGNLIEFNQLFSCEIEPFKQAYIRRNTKTPLLIFRDVVEVGNLKSTRA